MNIGERLLEAGAASAAQIELNKKRDVELVKIRKDLEECHIQNEATVVSLRRKHQDAVAEMSDQVEQLALLKDRYLGG